MDLKHALCDAFADLGIEKFRVLDYKNLKEINSRLVTRCALSPRSAIIFLVPYYAGKTENISVYAGGLDYHAVIKRISDAVISVINEFYPEANAVGFGDHSPIDERHAALIAGLGVLGKNGLIIDEKYGSYVFIGDIITDIPPSVLGCDEPRKITACVGCGRCLAACPTGILRGESNECLSAITQKKGTLTDEEIALMRRYNTCWGCDLCSSVCPYNESPRLTPIRDFHEGRITRLDKETVLGMTDEEFKARAFSWRGRQVVLRNLEYVYGECDGEDKS